MTHLMHMLSFSFCPMFDFIFMSANEITLIGFSIKSENQRHKKAIWLYPKYLSLDQKSETFEPYTLQFNDSFKCGTVVSALTFYGNLFLPSLVCLLSSSFGSTLIPLFHFFLHYSIVCGIKWQLLKQSVCDDCATISGACLTKSWPPLPHTFFFLFDFKIWMSGKRQTHRKWRKQRSNYNFEFWLNVSDFAFYCTLYTWHFFFYPISVWILNALSCHWLLATERMVSV